MMETDDDILMIPIRIDALAVGDLPGPEMFQWTDLTPRFELLTDGFRLGPDLLPDPLREAPERLESGIHLHFRLPAAFSHGRQNAAGELSFDRIPNRWIVQRLVLSASGESLTHRAWLVSSDVESAHGAGWPDIPDDPETRTATLSVRRIGTCKELLTRPEPEESPSPIHLSAVGPGDPLFAAYYPTCRCVLGFHDDMADVEKGTELTYLVSGYHAVASDDPMSPERLAETDNNVAEWLATRKLGFGRDTEGPAPRRLVCHGLLTGITWHGPDHPYMRRGSEGPHDGGPFPPRIDMLAKEHSVALGETGVEAVAALMPRDVKRGAPMDEAAFAVEQDLLAGLQEDLIGEDMTLDGLRGELHARRFDSRPGGRRFTLSAEPEATAFDMTQDETVPVPEPPLDLRNALSELNELEQQCDMLQRRVTSRRRQLHDIWCRWRAGLRARSNDSTPTEEYISFLGDPTPGPASQGPQRPKTLVGRLQADIAALRDAADRRDILLRSDENAPPKGRLPDLLARHPKVDADGVVRTATDGTPMQQFRLVAESEPQFHRPSEPAIAVRGTAMARRNTTVPSAEVLCRRPSELKRPAGSDIDEICSNALGGVPTMLDALHKALLIEALTIVAPQTLGNGTSTFEGTDSAADGHSEVTGNAWTPLLLAWHAEWLSETGAGPEDRLDPKEVTGAWHLGADGDLFRAVEPPAEPPGDSRSLAIRGSALATTSLGRTLGEKLRTLNEAHPLLGTLLNAPVGLQRLAGFNSALGLRAAGPMLPPMRRDNKGPFRLDPFAAWLGREREMLATTPQNADGTFMPIRAGRLDLKELSVIDSFGQTMKLPLNLIRGTRETVADGFRVAHSCAAPSGGDARLSPRLLQPARVRFDTARVEIAGWVMPNHLDKSLVLFDAQGRLVCALQKRLGLKAGASGPSFFPVDPPRDDSQEGARAESPDADLDAFRAWILSLGPDSGDHFFDIVNAGVVAGDARMPEDNPAASLLLGRPFALVRLAVGLELDGLPMSRPALPTRRDEGDNPLDAHGAERVAWPLRLGDRRLRTDGLLGVFFPGPDLESSRASFQPAWDPRARVYDPPAGFAAQDLTLDCAEPTRVTLLMDPQARVHATTGALPRTYFALPDTLGAGARRVSEIFFQIAPIIGHGPAPAMPRPSDDYGEWSWVYRPDVTGMRNTGNPAEAATRAGAVDQPVTVSEGWLTLELEEKT